MSLDMLGAVDAASPVTSAWRLETSSWTSAAATVAGGALGAYLGARFPVGGRPHPILGMLNGFAIAGNVVRVATKEISPLQAVENLGGHAMATVGSLVVPPNIAWLGYLAGAASSKVFLRLHEDERAAPREVGEEVAAVGEARPAATAWAAPEIQDAEIVGETPAEPAPDAAVPSEKSSGASSLVPAGKQRGDVGRRGRGALILGRPAWHFALVGLGLLAAAGGVAYSLGGTDAR